MALNKSINYLFIITRKYQKYYYKQCFLYKFVIAVVLQFINIIFFYPKATLLI